MNRNRLFVFYLLCFTAACASVNLSDKDDTDDSDSEDDAIPCDEENAEELCGDPELCVDGYCCDTPCEGGCEICNLGGYEGICSIAPDTLVCRDAAGLCDAQEYCNGENAECPDDEFLGAGDECRPAVDECDLAEYCDGLTADGCPEDEFADAETACGSSTDDECDNPDTCDGAGSCSTNYEPSSTVCGDPGDTQCDNPDICDGAGNCDDNFEPDTTVCGDTTENDCNHADTCDGSGTCDDNFEPVDTPCGDTTEEDCDHADTCDDSGACLPNLEPATTICRAAVNDCDLDEYCDGSGGCPSDVNKNPGDTCGDTNDTECDNPDTCDSSLVCQPNYEPVTVSCSSATSCEIAANCDGAGACGGGGFLPPGSPCGSTLDNECNNPDSCDAIGNCLDNYESSGIACGSAADSECDDPDSCDGLGVCQNNFEPLGLGCGDPFTTDCSDPDTCDATGTCLTNHQSSGTACGDPTNTTCNLADTCDSFGTCQQNIQPATIQCRPSAGQCDAAEDCDGFGNCPSDAFELSGTNCGSGSTECSGQDTCNGTGTCQANDYSTSVSCGSTQTEYQCSTTACLASPQTRVVGQHCNGGGTCTTDTGVSWTSLSSPCLNDEECLSNSTNAWCDLCDSAPSDYCVGDNAWHYPTNGTCASGSCSYTATEEICADTCDTGVCVVDVCTTSSIGFGTTWNINNYGFTPEVPWARGNPSGTTCHSGSACFATGLTSGTYGLCTDAHLRSPAIDLSVCDSGDDVELRFWHIYNIESASYLWDGGNLQFSSNNGTTWAVIEPAGTPYSGVIYSTSTSCSPMPEIQDQAQDVWGHSISVWQQVIVTIPNTYKTSQFRFRFLFGSDSSVQSYMGWVVDDVQIVVN